MGGQLARQGVEKKYCCWARVVYWVSNQAASRLGPVLALLELGSCCAISESSRFVIFVSVLGRFLDVVDASGLGFVIRLRC
jgi:hypothetical protein